MDIVHSVRGTLERGHIYRLPNEILLIVLEWLCKIDPVTFLGAIPRTSRRFRELMYRAKATPPTQDRFNDDDGGPKVYASMVDAFFRFNGRKDDRALITRWIEPLSVEGLERVIFKQGGAAKAIAMGILQEVLTEENILPPDDDAVMTTPLHLACQYKSLPLAKLLIERGIKFGLVDEMLNREIRFMTPFTLACRIDPENKRPPSIDLIRELVIHTDPTDHNKFLATLCCDRLANPTIGPRVLGLLMNDHRPDDLLLHACQHGLVEIGLALIEKYGFDVSKVDDNGNTYLHTSHSRCMTMLIKKLPPDSVNRGNNNGKTPLMGAAVPIDPMDRENDIAKRATILIDNGANVDARDKFGNTALIYACRDLPHLKVNFINVLLANGATVSLKNEDGLSAFDVIQPYLHDVPRRIISSLNWGSSRLI